ncbi:MAG: zinc-binding dehydrogenase [Thermoleophilia bacterium]
MQAIAIRAFGGPETLRLDTLPDPVAGPGEVVVELRACALNRRDTLVRKGVYEFPFPFVPGSDGAGVRRDTGEEVVVLPSLAWGEREAAPGPDFRILGGPDDGTYAELIRVPEENVFPKPPGLSWYEAAAFPLAGLTAYRALFTRARLEAGETVLVLGAGSGVATFAIQLARQAGARVLVTSSSQGKLERARELGAEAGIDYTAGDWAAEVRERTGGRGVDVVVDSVGSTWPDSLRALALGGRLVVFGATRGTEVQLQVRPFYFGQHSLLGTTMGSPSEFAALLDRIGRGDWKPVVDSVRPLGEAAAAHARMEEGAQFGKLVLEIGG